MQLLLGAGADADAAGGAGGATPLIQAALGGHVECVKLLGEYGADPAARDNQGFTAAMWAGFKHPRNSALLSAIGAATVAAEKKAKAKEEEDLKSATASSSSSSSSAE